MDAGLMKSTMEIPAALIAVGRFDTFLRVDDMSKDMITSYRNTCDKKILNFKFIVECTIEEIHSMRVEPSQVNHKKVAVESNLCNMV